MARRQKKIIGKHAGEALRPEKHPSRLVPRLPPLLGKGKRSARRTRGYAVALNLLRPFPNRGGRRGTSREGCFSCYSGTATRCQDKTVNWLLVVGKNGGGVFASLPS